jgi:hypothetical protein
LIFQQAEQFSTSYPQFSTGMNRYAQIRENIDFPCFRGSVFLKPFAFKAFQPVDNLFISPNADLTRLRPFSGA